MKEPQSKSELKRLELLTEDQWRERAGKHDPDILYLTPFEGPRLVVAGRTPTAEEFDAMPPHTLVFVYDDKGGLDWPWGESAWTAAQRNGYEGDQQSFNDGLANVGLIPAALDALNAELKSLVT